MIGRPWADVPIRRTSSAVASSEPSAVRPRYRRSASSAYPVMGSPASSWATAVARCTRRSRSLGAPLETSKPSASRAPVRQASLLALAHRRSSGERRRALRRPLIGLVALSREAGLVGTMTSAGTEVIDRPASTAGSTVGRRDVVAGCVVGELVVGAAVVVTVVGTSVVGADDSVTAGADELGGVAAGALAMEEQAAVRSANARLATATADDLGASPMACHRIAGETRPSGRAV